ncbi:bifunctional Nucleolar complex-associated protein 3/Armadillo-type fold [Babesia duncani]|uniref:Bifunctional Nucleolar complex-associated protein 3/Armadillo-type fold n=1 Tax=Babesia duncani TaxID=323732 RepID=A0AAD9PP69_9APIC|nr:bifunctional Nucleolar complex-associated protein 3/Armadillo-type fold [Babesia duncani]
MGKRRSIQAKAGAKVVPRKKSGKKSKKAKTPKGLLEAVESTVGVISKFTTLEDYKVYISSICNRATAYPEKYIKETFTLYDIVDKKGGGTDDLKVHASKLALVSMVAVASHLIPRISAEFKNNEVEASVQLKSEIENERIISVATTQLMNSLVAYIKRHVGKQPQLMIPLIAELAGADNRACEALLQLCVEYGNVKRYPHVGPKCLEAIGNLLKTGSLPDITRAIVTILKTNHFTSECVKMINGVVFLKKEHELRLSDMAMGNDGKNQSAHVEEALQTIVAKYIFTIENDKRIDLVRECLVGLSKFGLLLNATIQAEMLQRLRKFVKQSDIDPALVLACINAIVYLMKHTTMGDVSHLFDCLFRLGPRILPQLYQGDLKLKDGSTLAFSVPCISLAYVECFENLCIVISKNSISNVTMADMQLLGNVIQMAISQSLLVDSNVGLALLKVTRGLLDRVPNLKGLLDMEGMILSTISSSQSSFWELELLQSHVSPLVSCIGAEFVSESAVLNKKKTPKLESMMKKSRIPDVFTRDYMLTGLDVHELLHVDKDALMESLLPPSHNHHSP